MGVCNCVCVVDFITCVSSGDLLPWKLLKLKKLKKKKKRGKNISFKIIILNYRLFQTQHSFGLTIFTLGFRLFFYPAANKLD
jgi:hypothetical protein